MRRDSRRTVRLRKNLTERRGELLGEVRARVLVPFAVRCQACEQEREGAVGESRQAAPTRGSAAT
jgi:hypothetical protein